ncbi:MAG: hypothetical protein ACTSWP_08555 [Candidatus Freyarchaeota archaeon]
MFQEWWVPIFNMAVASAGRGLDLLSTWYVTPRLKLETGRIIGRLGWKGAILLQLPVVFLASLHVSLAVFVFILSLLLAAGNVQGAWFVKGVGEEKYFELMVKAVRRAGWGEIVLSEVGHLALYTVPAATVSYILAAPTSMCTFPWDVRVLALPILLATAFYGFLGTFRMLTYLHRLRGRMLF